MKLTKPTFALAALLPGMTSAAVLINYDAGNVGNGQLLNDITVGSTVYQQGALINETLPGNIFHNTSGRSLIQYGTGGYNTGGVGDLSNTVNITDNAGVVINGFTVYQGAYVGGNNSLGFLENGTRLGESGNIAGNGHAFANAGEFFLFSDVYNIAVAATDTVNISFRAGSDNGSVDEFSAYLLIDGSTVGTQIGVTQSGNSSGAPRLTFSATGLTAASTIQLVVEAESVGDNTRTLIDDVYMDVVPEPTTTLLGALGFLGLLRRRR